MIRSGQHWAEPALLQKGLGLELPSGTPSQPCAHAQYQAGAPEAPRMRPPCSQARTAARGPTAAAPVTEGGCTRPQLPQPRAPHCSCTSLRLPQPGATWSSPAPRRSSHSRCRKKRAHCGSRSSAARPGAARPRVESAGRKVGGKDGKAGGWSHTFLSSMARSKKRFSQLDSGVSFMVARLTSLPVAPCHVISRTTDTTAQAPAGPAPSF